MMNRFVFYILLLYNGILLAQTEYFVQINPTTCNYSIIDSVQGIQWVALSQTTFDKANKRYIFRGQNTTGNYSLYSIDATTGQVLYNPAFPLGNNFGNIRFDNVSGNLYGMHWMGASTSVDFILINPSNFSYSIIKTIQNLSGLNNDATIDEINHRFIFSADDSLGNHCLFSIDELSGNIISKPQFPGNGFQSFKFDNSANKLYGLRWSSSSSTIFVSINPVNFNFSVIDTVHYDLSGGISMGYATLNEINKHFTFSAKDINSKSYLYTLDVLTGNIVSSPIFPVSAPYNLIESIYDNSTGNLYALHWGPNSEMTGVNFKNGEDFMDLFPNPTNGILTMKCKGELGLINVSNTLGEVIWHQNIKENIVQINLNSEPDGIYFLQMKNGQYITTKKIVVQH